MVTGVVVALQSLRVNYDPPTPEPALAPLTPQQMRLLLRDPANGWPQGDYDPNSPDPIMHKRIGPFPDMGKLILQLGIGAVDSSVPLNGVPDLCEHEQIRPAPVPSDDKKNRFLSLSVPPPAVAATPPYATALRVTMVDLQNPDPPNLPQYPPPNFGGYECATPVTIGCTGTCSPMTCVGGTKNGLICTVPADCPSPGVCAPAVESNGCARWVGKPGTFLESQDIPSLGNYRAARLQCTPYYTNWWEVGIVNITGAEIVPSSEYSVQAYGSSCEGVEAGCTNVSAPVTMFTRRFGDVEASFCPPTCGAETGGQPNVTDVAQLVNKFKNLANAPVKAISQLQPNLPELNADINALDVTAVVDAVKQRAYSFSGPCPCPSTVTCGSTPCTSATPCVTALGAGSLCVKTCRGGTNAGEPCINDTHCPGSTCGSGFCRDRCGRCTPP